MIYYVFFCKGFCSAHEKCHDLVPFYFEREDRFVVKRELEISWVLEFIEENKTHTNITILFYSHKRFDYELPILEALSKYDPNDFMPKIFFFTFDYWIYSMGTAYSKTYNNVLSKMFQAKNHHVFTFCESLERLREIRGVDYSPYADKIFFDTNLWCCYASSHVPFNENPIPKIFVTGAMMKIAYPERAMMKEISVDDKDVVISSKSKQERYNDACYTQELSEYICSFASSIHIPSKTMNKRVNAHLILQKVFEILSSGSLLLCPKTEEPYLGKIGLLDNVNMKFVDMHNFNFVKQSILDPENRKSIDRMRRAGQELAKTTFTSANKFHEIMEKIESTRKIR